MNNTYTTTQRLLAPLPKPIRLMLIAMVVMSLGVLIPFVPLRALVVLPIALLLPGYAVVMAFFGVRSRLDMAPLLALSAMLSMALFPLLALLLNALGILLSPVSVTFGMDAIILLLAAVILQRTHLGLPSAAGPAPSLRFDAAALARSPWNGVRGGLRFVSIVAVVLVFLAGAMLVLPQAVAPPYSQLYLRGPWVHVNSIVHVNPDKQLSVQVGVTNHTHKQQTYHIVPTLDQAPSWPARAITLSPGASWAGAVSGYVPAQGCVHQLDVTLHQGNSAATLANLVVWLRGAPGMPSSCVVRSKNGLPF